MDGPVRPAIDVVDVVDGQHDDVTLNIEHCT